MLFANRKKERLSQASLETLAIIAYKQPVTKAQIELIRGVDCSGVLQHLQERALVEITDRLEAPGRPALYSTTREFLKHFGLSSLAELPPQERT
jgi:segregation and condensation protein B